MKMTVTNLRRRQKKNVVKSGKKSDIQGYRCCMNWQKMLSLEVRNAQTEVKK